MQECGAPRPTALLGAFIAYHTHWRPCHPSLLQVLERRWQSSDLKRVQCMQLKKSTGKRAASLQSVYRAAQDMLALFETIELSLAPEQELCFGMLQKRMYAAMKRPGATTPSIVQQAESAIQIRQTANFTRLSMSCRCIESNASVLQLTRLPNST